MKKIIFIGLLSGGLLTGPALAETTRTVEWWQGHSTERAAKLQECRNNPGDLGRTPNCTNAEKAEAMVAAAKKRGTWFEPLTAEDFKRTFDRINGRER